MNLLFKAVLILSFLIASVLMLTTCNENNMGTSESAGTEMGENFTFYRNEAMAEETSQKRSEEISDPFEIDNVTISDENGQKLMHIVVTQTIGCEESYPDKYGVIWDGIMLMIYPPQVGFFLTFNSSECTELQENVKETITLNLYDIFGEKEFVDDVAKFSVANASKISQENDQEVDQQNR